MSQNLLVKGKELKEGYNPVASAENAPLKFLEFGRLRLSQGASHTFGPDDRERAVTIFAGQADLTIVTQERGTEEYRALGARANVFGGKATAIYLPRESRGALVCLSASLEAGIFSAPARRLTQPRVLLPEDLVCAQPGAANWTRDVQTSIGNNVDADRLLVGETFNRPGCWSSYPPHKHDTLNPPVEYPAEEVYFFLVNPPQGFGIQRVYTAPGHPNPIDGVYVVENGDTTILPAGYHPVAAAAGYTLYYCWGIAGEERRYGAWTDDPAHAWVKLAEPLLNAFQR